MAPQHPVIRRYLSDRLDRGEIVTSSAQVIGPVLAQWIRHVDDRPPHQWSTELVASWVNRPELRASSRKSRLTKLRPFIAWLTRHEYLRHDPTVDIGRIRIPKGAPRDLSGDEVRRLLAACPDARAVLIVILMVQLGLRCGDAARILIEDLDLHGRRLHVRAKGGGGDHTHWEPITSEAWDVLQLWLRAVGRTAGPLITSQRRLAPTALSPARVSRMVGSWMRAAGLKKFPYDGRSAHALRHTCAQHMIDDGADLRDVQYTLGHRTIRSSEIYTLREPPGLREAMEGRSYRGAA